MKKLMVTVVCAFAAGILSAQDMSTPTAVEQAGAVDQGANIVAVAEEKAPALMAAPEKSTEFVSAEDVVRKRLRQAGITAGNGVNIGIGVAGWTFENPGRDRNFNEIRSFKATEAYLMAKAKIIESIKRSVSAMDRTVANDPTDDDPIMAAFNAQKEELDDKRRELAEKLAELDEAESEALYSTTITAKFGNVLDCLAKKLDKDFNKDKIPAEKRAVRDQIRKECEALKKEYAALERQAQKARPMPTRTTESETKLLSEMPLLGAVVVAQAESWDKSTGDYQMAMAVVWSPKLQETAVAMSEGNIKAGKPGKFTAQEWVDRQNLEVMVGPRSFTDKAGYKIFVGIGVADFECNAAQQSMRRAEAEAEAVRNIAFSIGCDMSSFLEMKKNMNEYSDGLVTKPGMKKSAAHKIQQSCQQELTGCQELAHKVFRHPISKRKTYVVAYYLNPELSNSAMTYLKEAYAGAVRQDKANQYKQGVHEGAKSALREQRASKADFNRGVRDGNSAVKQSVLKATSFGAAGSKQTGGGAAQGGAFSGDSTIDTDF